MLVSSAPLTRGTQWSVPGRVAPTGASHAPNGISRSGRSRVGKAAHTKHSPARRGAAGKRAKVPHLGDTSQVPDHRPAVESTAKKLTVFPWHDEVHDRFRRHYAVQGWARNVYVCDWALLRRMSGEKHPRDLTLADLESVVLRANTQGTRHNYVSRIKSIMRTLRKLGIIDHDHTPDEYLPKVRRPRGVPRPLTDEEAELLMTQASTFDGGLDHGQQIDMRHWFILGCLAGLRAMEVATIEGNWLEEGAEGAQLRVQGKGGTEMVIPAHPLVVQVIKSYNTLGRLWQFSDGRKISTRATAEMRRLGIEHPKSFHSCRHYFATKCLELSGGDLKATSELCRHLSLNTTAGYAATISGKKRSVVDAFTIPEELGYRRVPAYHATTKGDNE